LGGFIGRCALFSPTHAGPPKEHDDVEFGRKYLSHEDYNVQVEAVRIVGRFGEEKDAIMLIKIAKNREGLLQELAAKMAMTAASGATETARALLQTGDDILISITVGYLLNVEDVSATAIFLEPFLVGEQDTVRLRVFAYFVKKYSVEELEQLLERYLQRYSNGENYYYDVVCWLDRILYAPTLLKETYKRLLLTSVLDLITPVELNHLTAAEFY
jgi:hypothetical protein